MRELNSAIKDIPMPPRIKRLPINERGFPIPWFVWVDPVTGIADFRVIAPNRIFEAWSQHKCWICGDTMGVWNAFTIGPMCVVNRVNSEPPSHLNCAEYAVRACPFLANPRMKRNVAKEYPDHAKEAAGIAIDRNPGATAVYVTKTYQPFKVQNGVLFNLGKPETVIWYTEGRLATRTEVQEAIASGLPLLRKMAEEDGPKAMTELDKCIDRIGELLP